MTKTSIGSMDESHMITLIYLLLVFIAGIGLNLTALYRAIRVSIHIGKYLRDVYGIINIELRVHIFAILILDYMLYVLVMLN